MSGSMKAFIDTTTAEWFNGSLTGKPGGVFTSTSSMHGGQESTLLKYDATPTSSWSNHYRCAI